MKTRMLWLVALFFVWHQLGLPKYDTKVRATLEEKIPKNEFVAADSFEKCLYEDQADSLCDGPQISPQGELPFVIVITSYNNAQYVEKNLNSVFSQEYENFRVIYIDDASQDGTTEIVEHYIQEHKLQEKITVIKNTQRHRKLHNVYIAYHACKDYELIAQLDGDDWLAHTKVLTHLNKIFTNNTIWFSYGQYQRTTGQIGACSDIPLRIKQKSLFRKHPFVTSHLKVFYAWLFKLVKLEHLISSNVPFWQGKYYPVANDCATVFPMLEMACERVYFNPEIVYIFNMFNPISAHNSEVGLQGKCAREIKTLPVYQRLHKPVLNHRSRCTGTADCLILSTQPTRLPGLLDSIKYFFRGIDKITVLYQSERQHDELFYRSMKDRYQDSNFYNIENEKSTELVGFIEMMPSDYIICMNDEIIVDSLLDFQVWIRELERTFAYGCFGRIGVADFKKYNIPYQHVMNNVYAWKLACDKRGVLKPNNFGLTLYRKKDFLAPLRGQTMCSLNDLTRIWASTKIDHNKVGLFFDVVL